jgi:dipeptide/tripeptide permease
MNLPMSGARRLLILGGMALALWGMCYGLWYALFAEHQALESIGVSLAQGFASAANHDIAASQAAMARYRDAKYVYDRQVDIHGHWIGLAMVVIVVGLALDRLAFGERTRLLLALGLLLGAAIFPAGVYLQTVNSGAAPRVIAVLGSGMVIASLAGIALGFWKKRPAS